MARIKRIIKADQEKVRWLPNFRYGMCKSEKFFICSKCEGQTMEKSSYCPNCGAKMQGVTR